MNFGQTEERQKRLPSLTNFSADPYCTTALTHSTVGRDNAKYISNMVSLKAEQIIVRKTEINSMKKYEDSVIILKRQLKD